MADQLIKIISGCKRGDQKSYKALVTQYSKLLKGICIRYLKEESLADDALQETYIRIFKAINNVDETSNILGWMRTIAVNECIKMLRKRVEFSQMIEAEKLQITSNELSALDHLSATELLEKINELPDHYRIVFQLYEIEGYSHREIAEMLEIEESSSRTKLMRAKSQIKENITNSENQLKSFIKPSLI